VAHVKRRESRPVTPPRGRQNLGVGGHIIVRTMLPLTARGPRTLDRTGRPVQSWRRVRGVEGAGTVPLRLVNMCCDGADFLSP
jgi:hypothetical protein